MNIKLTKEQIDLLMQGTVVTNGADQFIRFNGKWYLLKDAVLIDNLSRFPSSILKETVFLQDVIDLLSYELRVQDLEPLLLKLHKLTKYT